MRGLIETPFEGSLARRLQAGIAERPTLYWLGQAGFVLDIAGRRLVIDPYLSDSLAEKYKGTARPHVRMMPPPVTVAELGPIDRVLCTHAHTDHMDPGTLKPLLAANPQARLVAPRAMRTQALERSGVAEDRLDLLGAGETLDVSADLKVTATRAAHETLETDDQGDNRFLGYVIASGDCRIWHSGDCIPFDGLEQEVAALKSAIALLPVNGRRPELSQNGVPGNFDLGEAIALAGAIGASAMIAHHYGLFDFNTAAPEEIDAAARSSVSPVVYRAREAIAFEWAGL
ncbi:MBL fold metallo-hydrolase [Rhizobium sp. LjRoot30]|uniref:MBL fold metallo-hydrolase n=1 Tax=Rhizobium sp. LjRoot30 TaxID=3342320 RepID=UPI003ECC358A